MNTKEVFNKILKNYQKGLKATTKKEVKYYCNQMQKELNKGLEEFKGNSDLIRLKGDMQDLKDSLMSNFKFNERVTLAYKRGG